MNPLRPLIDRIAALRSDVLVMIASAAGLLLLAILAGGGISWISVNRARTDLIHQGSLLTERYAAQATLALLYGAPDNARAATRNLLQFPNVVGVAVYNADGSTLLQEGNVGAARPRPQELWNDTTGTRMVEDGDDRWLFQAPVFVGAASAELTAFGEPATPPQYQGQVAVAVSKAALREIARDIVVSTATISALTALFLLPALLYILQHISRPIQALARVMSQTETGDLAARAKLAGPADVRGMEHAFNSMMDTLQERDRELVEARDVALSAARLKAQFTANVSHEIRTPLNGLLGMLQLLRETSLTAKQRERLTVAEASGHTLLTLINDILDFSRLESGRVDLESIPFDLPTKVAEVAALFELQTRNKGIALDVVIAPEVPPFVTGDPVRLGQVLTNLIGNAVKFTSAGGVTVDVDCVPDGSGHVRVTVTDTGIGIADEDIGRIFQSFTQADSSTTRQFGGSGLGLTITRQLVELMGGEIGVHSTPGQGSTFSFSLPLARAQLPDADGFVEAAALEPADRLRVLVAEDNATNQLVAKGLLEACGCDVTVVADGQAAIDAWAAGRFDAILMDCNMPGMDGLEATRHIRAQEAPGMRVPIVAMTANVDADLIKLCYAAGMDEALPKPMQLRTVRLLLSRWSTPHALTEPEPAADVVDAAATAATATAAVVNTALLGELQIALGDTLPTVIRTFVADSAVYLQELRGAALAGDTGRIRSLAHTLKGSARNVGADQMANLADHIERLAGGANPDLASLVSLGEDFDHCHGATREALAQWAVARLAGASPADIPQSGYTVLLVEDDRSTRLALRGVLDQEGYRVIEAGDGEEAMQLYPRVQPDLVLLDARLPRQDGFTTCRQMLALPQAQRTPVLMITSLADEVSVERAFRAGAADFITKPINFGVLRRRVGRLLEAGASERHAHRLAYHDALTGLPNRAGFRERLRQLLERAGADTKLAVLALDLDRFKVLNESLGHDVADDVLVQLADRIRRQLRADDLLGRVGSDEFALAFEVESADTARLIADKVLASVALPLHVNAQELVLSASIGIALYPTDDRDLDSLIRHAETALNQAKTGGGGQQHFWQTHMSVAVRRRLDMETDLRKAIERSELVLFYQPQMNLTSGMVTGVEALVRWQHPQRGLVSPLDFIPLAEDTGLIGPIGEWVLREACRQNRLWQSRGLPPLRMAVNVSGHQLTAPEFVDTVARALVETDHAPQRLEIEVTETTLMRNLEASADVLSRLRGLGVRLSIDDFGTGYSSLGYLKHLPVQTVKIDRSFVAELPENAHDAAITNGVIDMGHNLGLEVVGEGVETAAQLRYLRERGCDMIQGYLLHAPTTPDGIETWIKNNRRPNVAGLGVIRGPKARS